MSAQLPRPDAPTESTRDLVGGIVGLAIVLLGLFVVFKYFDLETLQGYIEHAGIWAPIVLVLAKASTIVIAPLGGAPLYPLAGALFGFWKGFLLLALGDALGGTVAFYLSRFFGRRIVNYFFSDNKTIDRVLRTLSSVRGLLIARIGFISLPEVVSYAAGLSSIGFFTFFLVYFPIGLIPIAATVWLGSLITSATSGWLVAGVTVFGMLLVAAGAALFWKYLEPAEEKLL